MSQSPVIDEAIQKTITAVETIAPKAWALAISAQRIDAELVLITRGLWVIGTAVALVLGRRLLAKWEPDSYDDGLKRAMGAILVCGCLALILGLTCDAASAVAVLLNPDVFAARALMGR